MNLDERITVADYDPRWPELFREESARIVDAMGETATGIEHVGSTSVPGLTAKPVVDLLVGVRSLDLTPGVLEAMQGLGYECLGGAGVPGRVYFRKRGAGQHFNAHFSVPGSENWENHLRVREYLRTHPDEAAAYSALKLEIAAGGVSTLLAYSERKRPWLDGMKARAREWKGAGGAGHKQSK